MERYRHIYCIVAKELNLRKIYSLKISYLEKYMNSSNPIITTQFQDY